MINKSKAPFKALPGWLICKPYIFDDNFKSDKEVQGDAQFSEVVSVGDSYIDDHGNPRTTEIKVKDVILHFNAQHTYTIKFDKYRAVHFSQVIGILKK